MGFSKTKKVRLRQTGPLQTTNYFLGSVALLSHFAKCKNRKCEKTSMAHGSKCLKLPKSLRNAIKKIRTFDFYTLQSAIVKQRYL